MLKAWIEAIRPRTLPLGFLSVSLAAVLAYHDGIFRWDIYQLSLLTIILLQILSNLANDYGDSIHGADSEHRQGPKRQIQDNKISPIQMRTAIGICTFLTVVSGVVLLWIAPIDRISKWILFGLGIVAILAAIAYTNGKKPYGYQGLGDVSVLIFFGFFGVLGTYYLYNQSFNPSYILPAMSIGLLMVAVLNINNIRDIHSDRLANKQSIPVRIGRDRAVSYHYALLFLPIVFTSIFVLSDFRSPFQFLFLITVPLLLINAKAVKQKTDALQIDPYLKQMVFTTILFFITFSIGHVMS